AIVAILNQESKAVNDRGERWKEHGAMGVELTLSYFFNTMSAYTLLSLLPGTRQNPQMWVVTEAMDELVFGPTPTADAPSAKL
ncbi:hypothetical protein STEG23_024776, partial [Scotinomys teguina]